MRKKKKGGTVNHNAGPLATQGKVLENEVGKGHPHPPPRAKIWCEGFAVDVFKGFRNSEKREGRQKLGDRNVTVKVNKID